MPFRKKKLDTLVSIGKKMFKNNQVGANKLVKT